MGFLFEKHFTNLNVQFKSGLIEFILHCFLFIVLSDVEINFVHERRGFMLEKGRNPLAIKNFQVNIL